MDVFPSPINRTVIVAPSTVRRRDLNRTKNLARPALAPAFPAPTCTAPATAPIAIQQADTDTSTSRR